MRVFDFNSAIARLPSETVVNGLRAGDHEGPTHEGVMQEHRAYLEALRTAGLEVTLLPPLPEFPDSMFVEDPALVFPEGAILLRPGAPSREKEAADLLAPLTERFAQVLDLPEGYADGGDVLLTPDTVFIGLSARTDEAGARALIGQLGKLGYKAQIAHTPPGTLHLKTASSLIDEETVLATAALAATDLFKNFRVLTVPEGEEGGANVLRANDHVLTGNRYPRTLEMLDKSGARLISLDVEQISRIDAGLTCMSLRWWAGA